MFAVTHQRVLLSLALSLVLGAMPGFIRPAHAGAAGQPLAKANGALPLDEADARFSALALPPPPAPSTAGRLVRRDQRFLVDDSAPTVGSSAAVSPKRAGSRRGTFAPAHSTSSGESNRFRITTLRLWAYQNFVPDGSDPDIFGIEVDSAWGWGRINVTNISYFELAEYPQPVSGMPMGNPYPGPGSATGISDLMSAFLFSKKKAHHGRSHFSAGFAVQLPTATDDTLGAGKWCVGPAIEYEYEYGRFFAAFVALNFWSVAGDADRKGVNMFMLKPMVTYDLGHRWKAVYMPYGVSIYWDKPLEDAVYLPVGGGVQKDFRIGSLHMGASVQFFKYVLRSRKGAEHELRFMLETNF